MNKQGFKGAGNQVAGEAKVLFGEATGDKSTELKGTAQKLKGKVQSGAADLRDKIDE